MLSLVTLTLVLWTKSASAETYNVDYAVLKAGTQQTSVADAYFSKPAQVTMGQSAYVVTITVQTSEDLGAHPVQILSINGQTPSVTKSKQGAQYLYTFSFQTTNVQQVMSGRMEVDIASLGYYHQYDFNLQLSASSIPALTAQKPTESAVDRDETSSPRVASSQDDDESAISSSQTTSAIPQESSSKESSTEHHQSSTTKQTSSTSSKSIVSTDNQGKSQSAEQNEMPFWPLIIGGLLIGFSTVAAVAWWKRRRHGS
jgi:heme-binding NEAT domain protein